MNVLEAQQKDEELAETNSDKEETFIETLEEVEEVMMSIFNTKESKSVKIMKLKGEIKKFLIYALLDNDS
jgi:hypothetical protein